jgi:uncharacterized protein (DUF305 family)
MRRRRVGWWLLVAVLAAGCTTSRADQGAASDKADVWFAQLSRVRRAGFDLALLKVTMARHRVGLRMATSEARDGGVPEVRQVVAELQGQLQQMTVWKRAWTPTRPRSG